ncbi:MAG: EscU/YscU/HrcU family type III secretion system export apparatus switch protein [Methylophilaceae bacterium]|nr:EscU/YscU/HrcU family type III secretion system export apparatus switch protein [Methylophilaceae bacterium]
MQQSTTMPTRRAIVLAYEAGDGAPHVVAKGNGLIAEAIINKAHEHDIFVHESKELVALLMQVNLDDKIPPALYQAIAEILAWLYKLEAGEKLETTVPVLTSLAINNLSTTKLQKFF